MKNLIYFLFAGTWRFMPKCVFWFFFFAILLGCLGFVWVGLAVALGVFGISLTITLKEENDREAAAKIKMDEYLKAKGLK